MTSYKHLVEDLAGKSGMINKLFDHVPCNKFVPHGLYCFCAEGRNLTFTGSNTFLNDINTRAISPSWSNAVYGAIGEYIERLTTTCIPTDQLIYGSYKSLLLRGMCPMDPNQFRPFAPWQYRQDNFPYKKLTRNDEIHWMHGRDYFSDLEILIPAALTCTLSFPGEKRYFAQALIGQAAGATLHNAIRDSFLETAERQAMCDLWFNQNSHSFITYSAKMILDHYPCEEITRLFDNRHVTIKVFDLGHVSCVESIVVFIFFTHNHKSYYSVGAASRFEKKEAIIKACTEAYERVDISIILEETSTWGPDHKKVLPTLFDYKDNLRFYNFYPATRLKSPLLAEAMKDQPSTDAIIGFDKKMTHLDKAQLRNRANVRRMYYSDLTIANWKLPFHVAKVILPGWVMMSPYFNYPALGNRIFKDKETLFLDLPHCFA